MKYKNSYLILLTALAIYACKPAIEKEKDEIKKAEAALWADSSKIPDHKKAQEVIDLYVKYADAHRQDPLSSEYLFKAGDIANGIRESKLAIDLYARVSGDPSYIKAPVALFLQGFIYENQLNDYGKAKTLYEKFLNDYPKHQLAKDAQFSLDNLGKSPEELVKSFEQNGQPVDSASAMK